MFFDQTHFNNLALDIVNQEGVHYSRSTSGTSKGEYFAYLDVPKDDNSFTYLYEKYGSAIPRGSRSSNFDKEKAKKRLVDEIAYHLSNVDKLKNAQRVSDAWNYYQSNKEIKKNDLVFTADIGRSVVDFFKYIDGEINESNWRDKSSYIGASGSRIGEVTNFKEAYYSIKETARNQWLSNNKTLSRDEIIKSYVFNSQDIPAVVNFESSFDAKQAPSEISLQPSSPFEVDLSKIANTGFVKVGFRKDTFLKGKVVIGRDRELVFPNDETHRSFFAIVELNDIIASHNEVTFGNSTGYPLDSSGKNVNDRNYFGDKNAQAKVVSVAQKLNPDIIISTGATASGTPIISVDGIVVSGNNRTMSLKLAQSQYKENFELYKTALFKELVYGGYGISMAQVYPKFKFPVLVRIDVDFQSYTSTELNAFNKPRSKSEKNIDRAIRLSKQISENSGCQSLLIELVSEQEIVSELYNDRLAVNRFKKIMVDCNIISENEISAFFTDSSLTETGKILYETLLMSLVLSPSAIEISQNAGVKSATNSILNAIIPLIKTKKDLDSSIVSDVNNALLIQNSMVAGNYKKLNEFITEKSLFEDHDSFKTPRSFVINWFLNQKLNDFKNTLIKYNNSMESNKGESLFSDSLPENEIFDTYFTKNVATDVLKAIETWQSNGSVPNETIVPKFVEADTTNEHKEITNSRLQKAAKYL